MSDKLMVLMTKRIQKEDFLFCYSLKELHYVYGCFTYPYVPQSYLVPLEIRKGDQMPWNWGYRMVVSYHVGTNLSKVLLTVDPLSSPHFTFFVQVINIHLASISCLKDTV